MEKLSPDFRFETSVLERKLKSIAEDLAEKEFDRKEFLKKLKSSGYEIKKLKPEAKPKSSFLSADSSIVKKELRYHALWGIHSVVMYSEFDGETHPDPLAHGVVRYGNLMYDSYLDLGVFWPFRHIDARANSLRVAEEYSSLLKSCENLKSEGRKPDYFLVDGSLQTTFRRLREQLNLKFAEHSRALQAHEKLLSAGKVVGLVEDSHSTDIARKLGLEVTNSALLELLLAEGEYISEKKDGVNICHLKLPKKKLGYTLSGVGEPLVVRWEFSYDGFEEDLMNLAGLWLLEDDVWHPQIYPLRVADYLTRKLKIGAVLDSLIAENGLSPRYREMREG